MTIGKLYSTMWEYWHQSGTFQPGHVERLAFCAIIILYNNYNMKLCSQSIIAAISNLRKHIAPQ